MTTEQDAELAARVARLQQRRGNTGAKSAAARSATPNVTEPAAAAPTATSTPAATPAPVATPKVAGLDSHFAFKPGNTVSTPAVGTPGAWAPPVSSTLVSATPPASMFAKIATVTGIHKIVQVANAHHEAQLAFEAQPEAKVIDKQTNLKVTKSRRRHAAAAGRVLATGLATSGFLGTITALAQADQHPEKAADPATDGGVTVRTVERTIYVDEFGNPIDPPVTTAAGVVAGAVVDPNATVPGAVVDPNATVLTTVVAGQVVPVTPAPGAIVPAAVPGAPTATVKPGTAPVTTTKAGTPVAATPTPGAATPAPSAAAPAPSAAAPAATPAPSAAAPVTTAAAAPAAPAPVVTAAPAPVTTAAPAPVTTAAPPPPPTTAAPAPVTTAAPACTGSKCT